MAMNLRILKNLINGPRLPAQCHIWDTERALLRAGASEAVFTVVLKSTGPLRNPIYKYSDSDVMNIEDHNLRRAILSRVCKNISHKYMNGINCIYLNYHRQGN